MLELSACWAAEQKRCHPDLLAVGVLGSYGLSEWHTLPQWNRWLAEALRQDTLWLGDPPP